MLVRIYRVYCLRPHSWRLPKHTALSEQLDGFNSCRRHTPYYTRRDSGVIGNLLSSRVPVLSIWRACICPIFLSFFFFPLPSWVGLGQLWGWGLAFTQCCYHTVIFYLTKIGEASRSFWLNPRAVRGAAGDSRMKMFQGFGKVDLPKLKWRSERRDGNARAMGGVLAAWLVAVKRQSLPWWLLASGCCWLLLGLSERRKLLSALCDEINRP